MPLGNSITFDSRANDKRPDGDKISYRFDLYTLLEHAGFQFDFVGSEKSGAGFFDDPENAGFPGITVTQMTTLLNTGFNPRSSVQETQGPYLDSYLPDIILLHIGTNNVQESAVDLGHILDEIDAYKTRSGKHTKTIIARIINRKTYDTTTSIYNNNVSQLVSSRNDSSLLVTDMENDAGIDYTSDMYDDLHPNPSGYKKMAVRWFHALLEILPQKTFEPLVVINPADTGDVHFAYASRIYAIGNPAPVFTLTEAPAGMTIDSVTGEIFWTPQNSGNFPVSVSISNSMGSTVVTYDLKINGPVPVSNNGTDSFTFDVYPTIVESGFYIDFKIPESAQVSLNIYNILGIKILDITNQEFEAGDHSFFIEKIPELSIKSTGILFVRMIYKGETVIRKVIINNY